jgi:DnaJ-class molecular chaperone
MSEVPVDCKRCNGSGEIGFKIGGRLLVMVKEAPGPVPEDAKGWCRETCPDCRGVGQIIIEDFDDTLEASHD